MEPLQDTFTVRTRDGREYSGLTLSSLRISAAQKIFSLEDAVRSDRVAGAWTPLARVLSLPEPASAPSVSRVAPHSAPASEPRVSTGIALDLGSHSPASPPVVAPAYSIPMEGSFRPVPVALPLHEEAEGPARHRLRIAGAFLLFAGILGMVGYALGRPSVANAITMLVNTGLGIALLMDRPEIRKWALGWVLAGWTLSCLAGTLAAGCFGLVLVGLFTGLAYGGPACLLWGEECPPGRFWTGVSLMGALVLLGVLGMVLVAVAGATLLQRMHV